MMRWSRMLVAVAVAVPVSGAAAGPGGTMTREDPGVRAELAWPSSDRLTAAGPLARDVTLTVTRGRESPRAFTTRQLGLVSPVLLEPDALRIADLDGDGAAEVVVTGYSFGAHCCYSGRIVHRPAGAAADRILRVEWGDVAGTLRDADADGIPEFVGVDVRFASAFDASYADSAFPARVLRFRDGRLVDASARYPAVVGRSMQRNWRRYLDARRAGYPVADVLAAYLADAGTLGRQRGAWVRARRAEGDRNPRMLRAIGRTLHRWGYRTA